MNEPIIEVKNLSKRYIIGRSVDYTRFTERLTNTLRHPIRNLKEKRAPKETIWALDNVSFKVNEGDVVGIIGKNGSGKSTLLKILSKITYPTKGEVVLRGNVGSLLEVGTGFHPELTGRENIYMNGAILGMKKKDIKAKFEEIVKFSEIEKFIDTPVKRYSSGMYVRLAFAVAAHLEPDILLIDEVLAVGDYQFQKKCLGKMKSVSERGRTVLFVSHNMNAIEQLCGSALLLEDGKIKNSSSDVQAVIREYLSNAPDNAASRWLNTSDQYDNPWFKPLKFVISDKNGKILGDHIRNDTEIWMEIEGLIETVDNELCIGYAIYNETGTLLFWSYQTDAPKEDWPKLSKGRYTLRSKFPSRLLNEGNYKIELIGGLHRRKWLFEPGVNAPSFTLRIQGGLSDSPFWIERRPGTLAPVIDWSGEHD